MSILDLNTAEITAIQFWDHSYEVQTGEDQYEDVIAYSADIVINECLLIQLSGKGNEAHSAYIPSPAERFWDDKDMQKWAVENLSVGEVEAFLERKGIENNFAFLHDNGENMNEFFDF